MVTLVRKISDKRKGMRVSFGRAFGGVGRTGSATTAIGRLFLTRRGGIGGQNSANAALRMAVAGFFVGSLVLLVYTSDGFRYTPRDLFPYSKCDIFYLEVTGKRQTLTPKHACAVESAAFHHPNRTVCLGMNLPISKLAKAKKQFNNVENLFIVPLDLDTIFRWTPLSEWWTEDFRYADVPWKTIHTSDATRLALLWKYGGLYLDLDMLVLRRFEDEEDNFVGIQYMSKDDGVNTAAMKFQRQHPFLTNWIYEVPGRYHEDDRNSIGPHLVTRLLIHYCQGDPPESKKNVEELIGKSCDYELHIFGPKTFYPIPWPDWKSLFTTDMRSPESVLQKLADRDTFAVHLWNELSHEVKTRQIDPESAFADLAKANCPKIFYREIEPAFRRAEAVRAAEDPEHSKPRNGKIGSEHLKMIMKWSLERDGKIGEVGLFDRDIDADAKHG